MIQFIQPEEINTFLSQPEDSHVKTLYKEVKNRAKQHILADSFSHSGDACAWYHVCSSRMSDVCVFYLAEKDEEAAKWIKNRALDIAALSEEEWLGPFYRPKQKPYIGSLETAHIAVTLCDAYVNGYALFHQEEKNKIEEALKNYGLHLCERYITEVLAGNAFQGRIINWFMVLLNGFGTCAAVLSDGAAMERALTYCKMAEEAFNSDSYGESLQYSSYAAHNLAHFHEVAERFGIDEEKLNTEVFANLADWYASSYIGKHVVNRIGGSVPQFFNFGDSAHIYRPSGDLLARIARKSKNERSRGLAKWLLEELYQGESLLSDELSAFGFHYTGSYCVFQYPYETAAVSPKQALLPEFNVFENGHIFMRDAWENSGSELAISAGYKPLAATAHRHFDQNSFQLQVFGERFFHDPGHCCYRLNAHQRSRNAESHNCALIFKNGRELVQKEVSGDVRHYTEPLNSLVCARAVGDMYVVISDGTKLYGGELKKYVRAFFVKLPHMMAVIDFVEADEPVSLCANFTLDNRENDLKVHIYNEERIVFRKGQSAVKLFSMYAAADGEACGTDLSFGWGYAHDYYHPEPNFHGQGKEGSGLCYRWKPQKEGKTNLLLHTICFDKEEQIRGWHVTKNETEIHLESPDKTDYFDLEINGTDIILTQPNGQTDKFTL